MALRAAFRLDRWLLEGALLDIIKTFEGKPTLAQIRTVATGWPCTTRKGRNYAVAAHIWRKKKGIS
jgi:hypothetical protein